MSEPTATLTCPKCRGSMRTFERNGIQIDQCEECRGVFLDRGELERLIDAESSYVGSGQSGAAAPAADYRSQGGHHGGGHGGGHGSQRRRGFLGELFD